MKIDRLPVLKRAGFDCRGDNANCPHCAVRKDDHGIYGGGYWFAVAADINGQRTVLVLEVMASHYPASVGRPLLDIVRRPRGAMLAVHRETSEGDTCDWLEGKKCTSEVAGFLRAGEIYEQHGNQTEDAAADLTQQSDAFWEALELQLIQWCLPMVEGASA